MMRTINTLILAVAAIAVARTADAQAGDSAQGPRVTITAGARYEAGWFTRAILGSGWRDVWTTPVDVPVLQLSQYAGGLTFDKRGGHRQSITVHFKEEKGPKEYVFRSVDKFPLPELSPDIQGTTVARIIQDATSTFFPAAPLLVPPLLEAIGALHVKPALYVMENSARLGVIRDTVAGMLGTFELKPTKAKGDTPGFGGSSKVEDSEDFLKTLASDEGHAHRLDEREFLATRLIDFLINDTDRTDDNNSWARFGEKGDYTWRPIPRDRDWAFMDARGLVQSLVISSFYPKFTGFGPRYRLSALLYSSHRLDRKLLQRLTARDFEDVALRVQQAVTDPVIARVVETLPPEWRETDAPERLKTVLRARRDKLPEVAMRFYRNLASDVDVFGTDAAERANIVRHNDGSVTVTVTAARTPSTVVAERLPDGRVVTTSSGSVEDGVTSNALYQRTFIGGETKEIRVYLGGGNDVATIHGASNGAITVRVIGGKGDDVLADSIGKGAALYDEDGSNQFIKTGRTRVVTKPWDAPKAKAGLRLATPWRPDWGGSNGFAPAFDYHTAAGLVVGGRFQLKSYGFRRLPYGWRAGANVMYGTGNGRGAFLTDVDYRFENSPLSFTVDARASDIEAIRFLGYGNGTPDLPREQAIVEQRILAVEPALVYRIGWRARETDLNRIRGEDSAIVRGLRTLVGKVRVGPAFSWVDPEPRLEAPLVTTGALGASGFGLAGMQLGVELDRTDDDAAPTMGWKLRTLAEAYPVATDLDGPFGTVMGSASAYLPIGGVRGPNVAVRLGGKIGAGDVPVQFAPIVGGRSSLRGFPSRRYTGDAAANAGVELRQPVGTVNILLKSRVGVFALADAGRVWFDGNSDGGWHTGVGGGFWLSTLGKSMSVAYARGDAHRLYIKAGLSY